MFIYDVLTALVLILAAPILWALLPFMQPDLKPVPVRVRTRPLNRR